MFGIPVKWLRSVVGVMTAFAVQFGSSGFTMVEQPENSNQSGITTSSIVVEEDRGNPEINRSADLCWEAHSEAETLVSANKHELEEDKISMEGQSSVDAVTFEEVQYSNEVASFEEKQDSEKEDNMEVQDSKNKDGLNNDENLSKTAGVTKKMSTVPRTVTRENESELPGGYTVRYGDTLSALAEKWGTTVEFISEISGISDVNEIKVGQTIFNPTNIKEFHPSETHWTCFVYSEPNQNSEIVGDLPGEYNFSVFGIVSKENDGWWKIEDLKLRGYIHADESIFINASQNNVRRFIRHNEYWREKEQSTTTTVSTTETSTVTTATTTATTANTTVNVTDFREWGVYYTKNGDNLSEICERFNSSLYTTCRINGITNPNFIYEGRRIILTSKYKKHESGNSWPVYKNPDENSEIITYLNWNQIYEIVSSGEPWYRIRIKKDIYGNKITGFARFNDLTMLGTVEDEELLEYLSLNYMPTTSTATTNSTTTLTTTVTTAATTTVTSAITTETTIPVQTTVNVADFREWGIYTVKAGDSLSEICATFWCSPEAICLINGITNPNLIWEGQKIILTGKYRKHYSWKSWPIYTDPNENEIIACIQEGQIYEIEGECAPWYKVSIKYNGCKITGFSYFEDQRMLGKAEEKEILEYLDLNSVPTVTSTTASTTTSITTSDTTTTVQTTTTNNTTGTTNTTSNSERMWIYCVKSGDTLYDLSQEWNTTMESICMLSNKDDPNLLMVGEELVNPNYFYTFEYPMDGASWCVWESASFESYVIEYLVNGAVVCLDNNGENGWFYVETENQEGYVSADTISDIFRPATIWEIKAFLENVA